MADKYSKQVIVTVSGHDRPGVTAALTKIISETGASMLDIKQVVVHEQLILAILIGLGIDEESKNQPTLKELLFKAKEFGLDMDFNVLKESPGQIDWDIPRYVITVLADELNARGLSLVAKAASDHGVNIDRINRLSEKRFFCLEFYMSPPKTLSRREAKKFMIDFKNILLELASKESNLDISFQVDDLYRRAKRLVVMDMDSTLIQGEVIDELAAKMGISEEVSKITEKAMRGEIDFEESLRKRVTLLRGLSEEKFRSLTDEIVLSEGAETLIQVLKTLGLKIALISGGFSEITNHLKDKLGLDYAYANELEIISGELTGNVVGPVVTPQRKADLMDVIAQQEGIHLQQVIAIGDGANDLLMLERAGMGIAFNAKPLVRERIEHSISQRGLDSILYLMGIKEVDIRKITG